MYCSPHEFTPRYAVFRNGWRVVPEDTSHVLEVTGEQLTEEGGAGAACLDFGPLSPTSKVVVQYEPAAAEVITVATGAGLTPGEIADAVWDETAAAHTSAGTFGELQAAFAQLASDQIALVREIHRLLGLDAAYVVEHGQAYIRVPPDGSQINIALTRTPTAVQKRRL